MGTHFLRFTFTALLLTFACLLPANTLLLQDQYSNGHSFRSKVEKNSPGFRQNNLLSGIKALKHLRAWKQGTAHSRNAPKDNRKLEKHAFWGFICAITGIIMSVFTVLLLVVTGGDFIFFGSLAFIPGLLLLFAFGAVAVTLGTIALMKMRRQPSEYRNKWQAVVALALGSLSLGSLGIIALLIVLILLLTQSDFAPQKAR
jgi:hypothetical protein